MQRRCALARAIGREELCSGKGCAFWEEGGAVVEAGCAIERLGVELSNVELARYLVDLRRALQEAHDDDRAVISRSRLAELMLRPRPAA